MCLSRFVVFRVTFNNLCCCLLSRIHLSLMDQSWQTGQMNLSLEGCFFTLLTSNWEVNSGCSLYSFISCILIKKCSSSVRILKTLKQIFQLESIIFVYKA